MVGRNESDFSIFPGWFSLKVVTHNLTCCIKMSYSDLDVHRGWTLLHLQTRINGVFLGF